MNQYLIERNIPGAGDLSPEELQAISNESNCVLAEMAPRAQWQHSYVVADKIVCVYLAEDEAAVREHAARGGFPADAVHRVGTVISPLTGG